MTSGWQTQVAALLAPALRRSATIRAIEIGEGNLAAAGPLFRRHFGGDSAFLVADDNTWAAAGAAIAASLEGEGVAVARRVLPGRPRLKPLRDTGDALAAAAGEGVPVAVGAGVINDLVKYAAHRLGRPYFCVATAASMDGYSSAGSPLVEAGFKKTIPCRPPRAILADLAVIRAAPRQMAGWGYGDLAGKVPAGGDWIVADALGIEPIDAVAWPLVQDNLASWLGDPEGVAGGDAAALAGLFVGLTVVGLAMEGYGSSRPASGADHQIAHLWEMANLHHRSEPVAHGAAVAVGACDALDLFDWLVGRDLGTVGGTRPTPDLAATAAAIATAFPDEAVAARALEETAAKHLDPAAHRARLAAVRAAWPDLRARLESHLPRAAAMRARLAAAGAPSTAAEIGVAAAAHRQTIAAARYLRSRYTVLDLLDDCGCLEAALDDVFASRLEGAGDGLR